MIPFLLSIILSVITVSHTFLIPENRSNNQGFCPKGFQTRGWLLVKFENKVFIKPDDRIGLVASDDQIILRFCESRSTTYIYPGNFCVFKGNRNCPGNFKKRPFKVLVSHWLDLSEKIEEVSLCCPDSIEETSTLTTFPIKPPFTLVKNGEECQKIDRTSVTNIQTVVENVTVLDLCYYDVDISCRHCQHTCQRTHYGAVCSCFQGYALYNNSHCVGSKCEVNNGGCDQICMSEISRDVSRDVSCSCYHGYYLYRNKICLPSSVTIGDRSSYVIAGKQSALNNNTISFYNDTISTYPLFTLNRDFKVMAITLAIVLGILFIMMCVCGKLNYILCTCPPCEKVSWSRVTLRGSGGKHRRLSANLNRNSISAPRIGDVAVDLLNRPKKNASIRMHDIPSRNSFYANATPVQSSEGGYDSLDRRRTTAKQTERHYDEPDGESRQPLMLPNTGNAYNYCAPDDQVPETPLPAYSNSPPAPGGALPTNPPYTTPGGAPLTDCGEDYSTSQKYEDPAVKFNVGTLGARSGATKPENGSGTVTTGTGSATVARIAPTPRSNNSHFSFSEPLKK